MPTEYSQIPIAGLSVGTVLTAPIYDPANAHNKLLGEQIEINEHFLKQLESRGIHSVSVSKRDLAAMKAGEPQGNRRRVTDHQYNSSTLVTPYSQEMDDQIGSMDFDSNVATSGCVPKLDSNAGRFDQQAVADAVAQREQQVAYMDDFFKKLIRDDPTDTEGLSEVCRASIQSVVSDRDLFLCLGLNPFSSDYPSRHSLHVCSVAISIGVTLGIDNQSLIDLGTGCLIHDVGMLKLGRELYKAKRDLTSSELSILADHPILTLEELACPGVRLSRVSRIVAYQIHERCNGSGYPRGSRTEEIHFSAKIAAVADAYIGLVSNRWHRKGLIPYYAIE